MIFRTGRILPVLLVSVALILTGCSVNPVTGEKQLSLIPESQTLAMGAAQYTPTIQTQGGQYTADPELTAYVQEVGQKLARVSDRPDLPYEFVVLNSGVPNAWALPGGKIALNRGLLTRLDNEAQLAAVLGHEIVHAAARHSAQRMQQGMLLNAGVAGLGMVLTDNEYAGLIMGGAALGSQLTMAQYSQDNELESDRYGIRYMAEAGYSPNAAIELQRIFLELSRERKSNWLSGLFASHPPSQRRVDANIETVRAMGPVPDYLGKARYQQKLAYLKEKQPAYDKAEAARKAAAEGELDKALRLTEEAIGIEPNDASFYSLKGQILEEKGQHRPALAAFDEAVARYPEMFSYRLGRGLTHLQLNNLNKAQSDLESANETVPTAIAVLRLGDIANRQGDKSRAAAYYEKVAQTQGEIAEEARRKLAAISQSDQ